MPAILLHNRGVFWMNKTVCLILLLAAFCITASAIEKTENAAEANYLDGIQGQFRSFDRNELAISIYNYNPRNLFISNRIKHDKMFFIIVPPNSGMNMTGENARFHITKNNEILEEVTWDKPAKWNLPDVKSLIKYKEYGIFRSWKLASLEVLFDKPLQNGENLILAQLDLTLKFQNSLGSDPGEREQVEDPLGMRILSALTLNPFSMHDWRIDDDETAKEVKKELEPYRQFTEMVNDSLTSAPVVKFRVYEEGIYGVSSGELTEAGVPVHELDPRHMCLYRGTEKIPIRIEKAEDLTFGPDGRFFFYAPPVPKDKSYYTYFLLYENNPEKNPPPRIEMALAAPNLKLSDAVDNIFAAERKVRFFDKNNYYHKMPYPRVNGSWYWDDINRNEYKSYQKHIGGKAPGQNQEFSLIVYLAGTERIKQNFCEIYFNNKYAGEVTWDGLTNRTFSTKMPLSVLQEGVNELTLFVPPEASGLQSDSIRFIGFEVEFPSRLVDDHSLFPIEIKPPSQDGFYALAFETAREEDFFLLDITNPGNPSAIPLMNYRWPGNPGFNSYCMVQMKGAKRFITASWNKTMTIDRIEPVEPLTLFEDYGINVGEYVILTHERFLDAIAPLAGEYRKEGLKVLITDIEDVFDCFGYGEKDPGAIQRFFKYRYHEAPGPLLRYGLLVGEASDYLGDPAKLPPGGQEDLIPTWGYGLPMTKEVHSDTAYTFISGDDELPDFALGRFSVYDPEQVTGIIKKTLAYKNNPPLGEWRINHAFVTDDEKEFKDIAENLIRNQFPPGNRIIRIFQQFYAYRDLLLVWQRKTSPEARDALINYINDGLLTLNYFGHGGPNLWTSERLFHLNDIPLLQNKNKPFFLTASTCDTSWLDYPIPPVRRSLGEELTTLPEGGCIGIYGPTTGASPSDHNILMNAFYDGIFNGGLRGFGESILYSKIAYRFNRNNKWLLEQFILLGDPALSFPIPEAESEINIEPSYVNVMTGANVKISGTYSDGPKWAKTRVSVISPDPEGKGLTDIITHTHNGSFEVEYEVTEDALTGRYDVVVYTLNHFNQEEEISRGSFEVLNPNIRSSLDFETGTDDKIYENEEVKVTVTVENLSEVELKNIKIILRQSDISEPILNREFDLAADGVLNVPFQWIPEMGVHSFTLETTLPGEKENQVRKVHKHVGVFSLNTMHRIGISPQEIRTEPDPIPDNAKPTFILPLYNLGNQAFYQLRVRMFAGGSLIGPPKTIKFLRSGQKIEVPYKSEASFPRGRIPIEVKVDAFNQQTKGWDEILRTIRVFEVRESMDLMIVPGSVSFQSKNFRTGETIFINAVVRNSGGQAAENFTVEAYRDAPWDARNLVRPFFHDEGARIHKLKPGEEVPVQLRWDHFGSPEEVELFVVANSSRNIKEKNYYNNYVSKTVELLPHTNLVIDKKDVRFSQDYIAKGDEIKVNFAVSNQADLAAGTFDIHFEEKGVNSDWSPCCEPLRVGGIATGESIELSTTWKIEPRNGNYQNNFRIVVNPNHLIQENYRHDNHVEYQFDVLDHYQHLQTSGRSAKSFRNSFKNGYMNLLSVNPLSQLIPADYVDADGILFNIKEAYILGDYEDEVTETSNDRDNKWHIREQWLVSSPWEDAPSLSFAFPVPEDAGTNLCDVYLHVQTKNNVKGFNASKLQLKVENEQVFKTYDFSQDPKPYATQRYKIGRYDLVDGFLDITIDDVEERFWSIIHNVEIVPLKSSFRSVILELPRKFPGRNFNLTFLDETFDRARIDYWYRFGEPSDSGGFEWTDWIAVDGSREPENKPVVESRYMQWKSELYGWKDKKPFIKDVQLEIEGISAEEY